MRISATLRKSLVFVFIALFAVFASLAVVFLTANGLNASGGTSANATTVNGDTVEYANNMQNGVQVYYGNADRDNVIVENKQVKLDYNIDSKQSQLITSLKNSDGDAYISGTSDVFVKMNDGNTYYASASDESAYMNIHRLGYYYYDTKLEGQNFYGDLSGATENSIFGKTVGAGGGASKSGTNPITVSVTSTTGPYLEFYNLGIALSSANYQFLKVTLSSPSTASTRGFGITLGGSTGSGVNYTGFNDLSFTYNCSSTSQTYYIPIADGIQQLKDLGYSKFTAVRLNMPKATGESYSFTELALVTSNAPYNLKLSRAIHAYSDKLHTSMQIASDLGTTTTGISSIGFETKVTPISVANNIYIKRANVTTPVTAMTSGQTIDGVEYVGVMTEAGVYGTMLPYDAVSEESISVSFDGYVYTITHSRTVSQIVASTSASKSDGLYTSVFGSSATDGNANDFRMGERMYTDTESNFDKFVDEATAERNPLDDGNIEAYVYEYSEVSPVVTGDSVTYVYSEETTVVPWENGNYVKYDSTRGHYEFRIHDTGFGSAYYLQQNKHFNVRFTVRGDSLNRKIYMMTSTVDSLGTLESAVLLNEDDMLLPVPVEVGKNFTEGADGERNLWNINDSEYSEAIVPLVVNVDSEATYNFVHLYQNWGNYPLKQISWVQYAAPYYHISTGVVETNCIKPWYVTVGSARSMSVLPDHRTMSGELWNDQPQHTSGGNHTWLKYGDVFTENTKNVINSYGPTYASVTMDYVTSDGVFDISYTHTEFPQTDENRAYYEIKYTVNQDITLNRNDFQFYSVSSNISTGIYDKIEYLGENNTTQTMQTVSFNGGIENQYFTLGSNKPYFALYDMKGAPVNSDGSSYTNLSFLVDEFTFTGSLAGNLPKLAIINEKLTETTAIDDTQTLYNKNRTVLTFNTDTLSLKAGDTITLKVILMPWGDHNTDFTNGATNVRDVRVNTLLNPLTVTAGVGTTVTNGVPSVVPTVTTNNGETAEFTLTGGQNNVPVKVTGFNKLTVPAVQEYVDGEWVNYNVSSATSIDDANYGNYYDGYGVTYENGKYAYSFVVTMDYNDLDGRTFRVSASKDFTGWSESEPENDKGVDAYISAQDIWYRNRANVLIDRCELAEDGSYVTVTQNSAKQELYFNDLYLMGDKNNDGVTGQYIALKYRYQQVDGSYPSTAIEFYAATVGHSHTASAVGINGSAMLADGEWHVAVIDLATRNPDNFVASEGGKYRASQIRFDPINDSSTATMDIAFVALCDNLNDLSALVGDGGSVDFYSSGSVRESITVYANADVTSASVTAYITNGEIISLTADTTLEMPDYSTVTVRKNGFDLKVTASETQIIKIFDNADGKTVTVATYVPFAGEKDAQIGMNLGIKGNIRIITKFPETALKQVTSSATAYLEVTTPQRNLPDRVERYYAADLEQLLVDGRYEISAYLAPAQQTDWVSLQIVDGEARGILRRYSIRSYADRLFELVNDESIDPSIRASYAEIAEPIRNMLNGGAYAQQALDYNTDNLANAGLYVGDDNPVLGLTITDMYGYDHSTATPATQTGSALVPVEYAVELSSATGLKFYVNYTGDGTLTATVKRADKATAQTAEVLTVSGKEGVTHYVYVTDIPVHKYDLTYTVTVSDGNGNSATFEKSVLNYVGDVLSSDAMPSTLKNAVSGMYLNYAYMKNYVTGDQTTVAPNSCAHTRTHLVVAKKPTCCEKGVSNEVCSDCGATLSTKSMFKLGHDFEYVPSTTLSCTTDEAPAHYRCKTCSEISTNGAYSDVTDVAITTAQGHTCTTIIEAGGKVYIRHGVCDECGALFNPDNPFEDYLQSEVYGVNPPATDEDNFFKDPENNTSVPETDEDNYFIDPDLFKKR